MTYFIIIQISVPKYIKTVSLIEFYQFGLILTFQIDHFPSHYPLSFANFIAGKSK